MLLLMQLAGAGVVQGFSLLGPFQPWMNTNTFLANDQFGGPMEVDKGYRWIFPVVTYGFTPEFVQHFGTQGVAAVDAAAAILNSLPPASEINPTNFPLDVRRVNFAASVQSALDLKSHALGIFINTLGLGPPVEAIFMVNGLFPPTNAVGYTNYPVVQRNYDPLTGLPSDAVNGKSFTVYFASQFGFIDAFEIEDDPLAIFPVTAADRGALNFGEFLTGLTCDDVGGLRHLLHPTNRHVEPLRADVSGFSSGGQTNFVNIAERGGMDKIQFVHTNAGVLSFFQDVYFLNGTPQTQLVARTLTSADILFTVQDPGPQRFDQGGQHNFVLRPDAVSAPAIWQNCAALNGNPGGEGPGIIQPGITVAFHNLGRYTSLAGTQVEDLPDGFQSLNWGSFDGSTNPPTLFGIVTNPAAISLRFETSPTNGQTVTTWALLGRTSKIYRFESSTNLLDWTNAVSMSNASGILRLSETNADPQRFYRVSETPP
ncbi:MAG: hypothetical protein HY301_13060 [Verrucomicrobia bacterium]|nr:hypothetical protein [Verrucomicrobiota bacterium]